MKSSHQQRVEEFMRRAGQQVPSSPVIPSQEIRKLRATLILEEALETIKALGFDLEHDSTVPLSLVEKHKPDLVEIADGCADISVVTVGTLSACGIPDLALLELVDDSNLAKFGPSGYRREDGKWIKPPDWRAPDIRGLLVKQGW